MPKLICEISASSWFYYKEMLNILYKNPFYAASFGNDCKFLIQNLYISLHSPRHIHFLPKVKIVQCCLNRYRLSTVTIPFKIHTVQLLDTESLVSNFCVTNLLPRVPS